MKVLVIGQGGREHAIVLALKQSPSVAEVQALPGSDGIARDCRCHDVKWEDFGAVAQLVERESISLVVIGPEVPLAQGLSDELRKKGVVVFGPSQAAARLESSKVFSKEFMVEAGAPTARFHIVRTVEETDRAGRDFSPPYVLKADGLAAGKGVFICDTRAELLEAARELFEERLLGAAGDCALLEEFSKGYELSYLILTNGETFSPLILAQDHKRLRDHDQGLNTGGMGVAAPVHIPPELQKRIDSEIVRPILKTMKSRGLLYRGILYIGLMITENGPSIIEFNVRFGDPEAQVILPLLDGDWGDVFLSVAQGHVPTLSWRKQAAACVVLAAEGYPDTPVRNVPIEGLSHDALIAAPSKTLQQTSTQYFLHAGTRHDSEHGWVTAGGRILNSVGVGDNLRDAIARAYSQASLVRWPGMQMRRDIGAKLI